MSAINEGGYTTLQTMSLTATVGTATATGGGPPGSGATVLLWSSVTNNPGGGKGARYKMLVTNIITSHDSAANGLKVYESSNKGTTWDLLQQTSVTAAGGYTKTYTKVSAPDLKVEYTNSANVLTTWRGSIMGDSMERSNG